MKQMQGFGWLFALVLTTSKGVQSQLPEWEGFIRVQNSRFVDANCQDFPVSGFNTWMLMEAAAGLLQLPCELSSMDAVQYTFSTAAKNGMTVIRVFGHGVNNTLPLQTSPGVYNETAFTALDYILDTAAYHGVKLILTLGDNWQYADSKRNYNAWAGYDDGSDQFWINEDIKNMYKAHMTVMANRVNTLNGLKYKDDDTIFAWNLMNEPRCNCFPTTLPYPADFSVLPPGCNPSCADSITAWVQDMSATLKAVDPNHMVTVGEEGFWGYNDPNMQYNPENSVSPWAALTGNNFTAQHAFDTIDFAGVHYWPDQWTPRATSDWDFFLSWMTQHGTIAKAMGKPLVLEELGTAVTANQSLSLLRSEITSHRTVFMDMVYGQFNQSLQNDSIWRGTLFWKWGLCPENVQDNDLEVAAGDSDFQDIVAPASIAAVEKQAGTFVDSCEVVEVVNATVHDSAQSPGIEAIYLDKPSAGVQNATIYDLSPPILPSPPSQTTLPSTPITTAESVISTRASPISTAEIADSTPTPATGTGTSISQLISTAG